ncbi:DUF397 domain-containing protein [Actinomadura sp. NEAU-AAG7]|uniref:DUF397 domain-containing protein n=1 Tax=Actinomadura sp. NEAU-AAG7 TaxID=2839640 RepID=UPI001BE3F511|nr:DUF397 domain-containing protein [Actinomadura sp. NEAU-AAG7]MBT2211547.1 DUF397 domain-containing protein [Actinomadura sp. NEAU-AAG7]
MTKNFRGWRKSRHSNPDGHCVEVGRAADGTIGVRDTELHGMGPIVEFTKDEWLTFLHQIRSDRG